MGHGRLATKEVLADLLPKAFLLDKAVCGFEFG
jgi:hypothetical protein